MEFHFDATFFAFVGLVLFLALVVYLKAPAMMARSLDDRATRSATSWPKPSACARKPSICLPNTSVSARKRKPRRLTSLPPPSAKPRC